MSIFKRNKLIRLNLNELKDITEEVLELYSPNDLNQLKENITNYEQYILTLTGTPYWFCAQFLDRYVLERLDINSKDANTSNKLFLVNFAIFESILSEREFTEADAKEIIKEQVKSNLHEENYNNAATSFIFDYLTEIYRYEALHNPYDLEPNHEQIGLNIDQFRKVIKAYIKVRNSPKISQLFTEHDL